MGEGVTFEMNATAMKKKGFLFAILGGVVAVTVALVLVWNKPHKTVEGEDGIHISAEALAAAFENNEEQANATYLSKVLVVDGTIAELTKNQNGKTVLLLGVENPLSGIQCTMQDENATYQIGQRVSVKGFCNGYTLVVLLSDCIDVN